MQFYFVVSAFYFLAFQAYGACCFVIFFVAFVLCFLILSVLYFFCPFVLTIRRAHPLHTVLLPIFVDAFVFFRSCFCLLFSMFSHFFWLFGHTLHAVLLPIFLFCFCLIWLFSLLISFALCYSLRIGFSPSSTCFQPIFNSSSTHLQENKVKKRIKKDKCFQKARCYIFPMLNFFVDAQNLCTFNYCDV